ncbi:MAG: hypothetical protein PVI26_04595, partial [Chitinispirillia bacterium]
TGANENVIFSSSNIFYFKKIMYLSNINTPKWQQLKDIQTQGIDIEFPFIVKPIYKGKSKEVPEQLLLHSESEFYELYNKLNLSFHKKYFIEPYIKGQDLNIYLLGSDSDPEIFANYEGLLSDFNKNDVSDGIDQESFNSFLFDTTSVNTQNDTSVGNRKYAYTFKEIALTCWNNYLFSGYGEIHFRIDCFNKPWIVGITINPSLSLNSPFVKSAVKRGYSYEGIIIKIIDESIFY